MTPINIDIPDELAERLDKLAEKTGRTKNFYVRAALKEKLNELENYYFSIRTLEKVAMGQLRIWTQEEIEQGEDLK